MGDPKGKLEGWGVFSTLNGDDGLSRYASFYSQLFLGHFVMMEPQFSNVVPDLEFFHLRTLFDTERFAQYLQ